MVHRQTVLSQSRIFAGLLSAACLIAALWTTSAQAQSVSTKSRSQLFKNQLRVLDGRAAEQYQNSVRLQPTPEADGSGLNRPWRGSYKGPFLAAARAAARRHAVPEDLFLKLVQQESGWKADAVSPKGALGLAQLMPATARALGVDPDDPMQNLDGGARYLSMMHKRFRSWRLALAAYNAGPEAVDRHGGVPPYKETQNYVRKIWGR